MTERAGTRRALVVADHGDEDAGYVGQRLQQHGFRLDEVFRPVPAASTPEHLAGAALLLLLGSADAVHDPLTAPSVAAESELVREALRSGVPVLGICYGAQLAAHALGGSVGTGERGEVGWFELDSTDDELCGAGPWFEFHSDVLTLPPGARLTGSSSGGPQGFVLEPGPGCAGVVAWQFHPEVTPAIVERWVAGMPRFVRRHCGDPDGVVAETWARAPAAAAAAASLVDSALAYLGRSAPASRDDLRTDPPVYCTDV
jgi:GMP synthase (glutamine-hydrolysing)